MSDPIISVSGLRGIVGRGLTPAVAMHYAAAFASTLGQGAMVVGRDGRATGRMFADAVSAAVRGMGRTCIDADVAATPTVGVLVRQLGAAGGIQITASHNPPQYNGIKLFNTSGRVLTAAEGQGVLDRYRDGAPPWAEHDRIGRASTVVAAADAHWQLIRETIDTKRIAGRRFKVLLDSNHGSGSVLGSLMLEELGCEVTFLGGTPDGQFEHPPEPLAENLRGVLDDVRRTGADIGFCQDPDADRLAIIDETGRYLGEETTLALCVDHVLRHAEGVIVTNCSTSRMTEDLAKKYHVPFFRAAVGEANVVEVMEEHEAILGGEGNGGVIDPRVGLVRDSFVAMALVLDAMAERELPVSALADELPHYEIVKTKIALDASQVASSLTALERHFKDAACDRMDGLRLDWPGKWLLVRASNTEPVVRAIAEAATTDEAQRLCDEVRRVLAEQA